MSGRRRPPWQDRVWTRRARWRRRLGALLGVLILLGAGFGAAVFLHRGSGGRRVTSRGAAPPRPPASTRPPRPTPSTTPKRLRGRHDRPVPILMYHVVSRAPSSVPYPGLFVSPADFAAQMRWLARHGYHAVTLRRVYDYWLHRFALPRRPIVISFDDGYLSQYTHAFPVLRALHWRGVLNLKVGNESAATGMPPRLVRRLVAAGWEIDAHTITHPDLTRVGPTQLRREVAGSRTLIRRRFHVRVDFFCYPSGRYDALVLAAVRAAGYLAATTTTYGLASPHEGLFTLDRIRINGSDGLAGFAAKLGAVSSSRP